MTSVTPGMDHSLDAVTVPDFLDTLHKAMTRLDVVEPATLRGPLSLWFRATAERAIREGWTHLLGRPVVEVWNAAWCVLEAPANRVPPSLYPDDRRTSRDLVLDLGRLVGWWTRQAGQLHHDGCNHHTFPSPDPCSCGLPQLIRGLTFAFGMVAGLQQKALTAVPETVTRTAALDEVVRILVHALEATS